MRPTSSPIEEEAGEPPASQVGEADVEPLEEEAGEGGAGDEKDEEEDSPSSQEAGEGEGGEDAPDAEANPMAEALRSGSWGAFGISAVQPGRRGGKFGAYSIRCSYHRRNQVTGST